MEWTDKAIIIHVRPFGEGAAIVSALTHSRGVRSGLVKHVKSKAQRGLYQPSYHVELTWKGRQEEQLGFFKAELIDAAASRIFQHPTKLQAVLTFCAHLHHALPEHESFEALYDAFIKWLNHCTREHEEPQRAMLRNIGHNHNIESQTKACDAHSIDACNAPDWLRNFILLEKLLLEQMGYGMDLTACAATGVLDDLIYLSPKTGRAVCREAGKPYHQKLMTLPDFFKHYEAPASAEDISAGLRATGYFLGRYLYPGSTLPLSRSGLI